MRWGLGPLLPSGDGWRSALDHNMSCGSCGWLTLTKQIVRKDESAGGRDSTSFEPHEYDSCLFWGGLTRHPEQERWRYAAKQRVVAAQLDSDPTKLQTCSLLGGNSIDQVMR